MTDELVDLGPIDTCPPGECREMVALGRMIAVFHVDGQLYGLDGVCPHQGGPLGKGELNGHIVTCPWHGWQFDVRDGQNQITPTIYAFVAALAAWVVATYTNVSILDLLLFGFAMVVPPALSVAYVVYWPRTTELGAYWGMAIGYGSGLIWFAAIKISLAVGFTAQEGSGLLRQILAYCFTVDGEGIDPSYPTFFVPLVAVPIISMLTKQGPIREDFYEILSGRKRVDKELV